MDVAQSSSSSEAETSEEETVDEDTLLCSPLEQETETGTAHLARPRFLLVV